MKPIVVSYSAAVCLCILFFCGIGTAKLAPDFIHPCNVSNWKTCLVSSTQLAIPDFVKGIPSLGVTSLDPFIIEKLAIPLNGLKVTFYQGKVSGFRKCIVDDVISELEKRHFVLAFHCNLTIRGQYDAVGQILLFPINGEGDAKVKLTNLRMKVDINTKYIKDDKGLNYFSLKNYKYTFDYGDRVSFDLKNLFKESKELTDFIHPCNVSNWKTCLVSSTQLAIPDFVKGIPSLGVTSLDPFIIEKLAIPLNGLKVTFYQGKVSGFRKCIVDDVISELEKRHFVLAFHCNLTIRGQYDAVGQILLFPINGEGDAKVKLTNLRMKVDINTKYIKDDKGLNYFSLKNYKYTFDYGDRVSFDLKNLFKESKELSDTVLVFLNDNWRTVAEEFGKPIVDYAVDLAIRTIEKFFLAVPYEELVHVPIPKF